MEDKQTVVDWLVEVFDLEMLDTFHLENINKAKEMYKQQIIDAHCNGQNIEDTAGVTDAIDYYNETYKK